MLDQLRFLMVAHLLRSTEVISQVSGTLEPDDFYMADESGYRLLWAIARQWWNDNHTAIPQAWLQTEIISRLAGDVSYMSADATARLFEDVHAIYDLPAENLVPTKVLDMIQQFLNERRTLPALQNLHLLDADADLGLKLSELTQMHSGTRIGKGGEVDLFENLQFPDSGNTPTGVLFLDLLLGGGTQPGECLGLLGVTGCGKTTVGIMAAVETARQGRRAAYFSYEDEIKKRALGLRIYGYVGKVPFSVLKEARGDGSNLPEQYRKQLKEAGERLGGRLHTFDMKKNNVGKDGLASIEAELRRCDAAGKHIDIVVIDQFEPMIQMYMMSHNMKMDKETQHALMGNMIAPLKDMGRPDRYNCATFLLHQSDNSAKEKSATTRPRLGQAANNKSFENYLDGCLAIGTQDANHRLWAVMTKRRGIVETPEVILTIDREYYRMTYEPGRYVAGDSGEFLDVGGEHPTRTAGATRAGAQSSSDARLAAAVARL